MPMCPQKAVPARKSDVSARRVVCASVSADVTADQFRRQQQLGVPLDLLPFQRVDAIAGPHPIGPFQDPQIDPATAAGAGLDLQPGVPVAQLVQQPVDGQRVPRAPRDGRRGPWPASTTIRL